MGKKQAVSEERSFEIPVLSEDALDPAWGLAACVDVETTGLDSEKDEIIELAILLFAFDRNTGQIMGIVDEYVGQREPERSIPRAATAIHGLTKRMLKGKSLDYARITAIAQRAEFYVAHNSQFDAGFCCDILPRRPWYCSMNHIDWEGHGFKYRSLEYLLKRHKLAKTQTHRAGDDTRAVLMLLSQKSKTGEYYFSEMLRTAIKQAEERAASKARIEAEVKRTIEVKQKRPATGCLYVIGFMVLIALLRSCSR